MSVNNIYLVVSEPPFKRYVKTVMSKVSGIRLDSDGKGSVGFILQTDPDGFNYDEEVLEIYSDREDRYLKQSNKTLFRDGFLKEYVGNAPAVDTTNILTDTEVADVASTRNIQSLQKKLQDFTSPHTVRRVLAAAEEIGRPVKTIELIKARIKELEGR